MRILTLIFIILLSLSMFAGAAIITSEFDVKDKKDAGSVEVFDKTYKESIFKIEERIAKTPESKDKCELYGILGDICMQIGNFEKAKACADEMMRLNDQNAKGYELLGRYYIETKCFEEADAAFQKVLEKDPKKFNAVLGVFYSKIMLGKKKEAEDFIKDKLKGTSDETRMHGVLGGYYYDIHNYPKAIEELKIVLKEKENSPYVNYLIGDSYENNEKYGESLQYFKKAIEARPYYFEAYSQYLYALLKMKKYDDMQAIFDDKSVPKEPEIFFIFNKMKLLKLVTNNEYESAYLVYQELFFDEPFQSDQINSILKYWVGKNENLKNEKDIDKTKYIKNLKKEEKNMNRDDYYSKLCDFYVCAGYKDKAAECAAEWAKEKQNGVKRLLKFAFIYFINGDFTSAEKEYKEILAKENNPEAVRFLALLYDVTGRAQKAVDEYSKILEKNPANAGVADKVVNICVTNGFSETKGREIAENYYKISPDLYASVSMALISVRGKKYDDAEKYLKKAILLDHQNSSLSFMLFLVYNLSDQKEQAEKAYENYIKLKSEEGGIL